ncbi:MULTISPECIES: SDR family oxidoreductase [Sphingobium]|uniref:Short-chain dehydrogenase n=1 Tax=Sphingobium xenophagum TaxID=121428 RepID=A0A401IZR3_SPHXE|nr:MULTISPECIES: SDR family oxidoreductase [Sphingobium]MBG6119621.1 NAD(P)-dependent dehydrogenase (short-subunit alcohol dehydrogenase family) [Sphingobium sp. JAI105]PSO13293.1 short-chain dehydrogenase [Sphingobium sp. AEW4]TWD11527.1 NAD(P)-dependent dehydrogenase (short-subunit alcohol dehydrogenase family) [Sphingobium sp. AEW010]TWD28582.1 NAD(P)-dependent dehydrogenase (short-subunit alcohol dehydrogenase family) [Sphingobium sp. AEW013]TWD30069.1 NAD(P)-dependent dehydrogenase (short
MIEEDVPYRPLGSARGQGEAGALPIANKRLALVTGGHRRLGGIIAGALARAGHSLAIHGSHDTRLDSHLALTLEEEGTQWEGFVVDFADPENAEELIAQVAARFGRPPDILVNSAALFGQDRLDDVTAEDLMRHYAVNCAAPAMLTKAFATVPAGSGDRCIINILDQRIDHPHGDQLAYTLSKLALAGLTRTTASSLAPQVRVNAVAPGLTIATPDYDADQMARLEHMMPLGRLPQAEQIAQAVLYLVDASAVTGQTLYVDGGAHMRSYDRDFMHLCR